MVPVINSSLAYFFTKMGWVNKVTSTPPWTLPGPIGAFLATNGDFRAVLLSLFLIFTSILIYYPFFKAYDKKMVEEEKNNQEENNGEE